MSSYSSIYQIASPHTKNPRYLTRYIKFVLACQSANGISEPSKIEHHHILPKSIFPEYETIHWNIVKLTPRQHFLAHWILWKAMGGTMAHAFNRMQHSNKYQHRSHKISSRIYEAVKSDMYEESSKANRGLAIYVDESGNRIRCSTKHPKVLSGEYISTTKGRTYGPRSQESKEKTRRALLKARFDPGKKVYLYFLDIRIEVLLHSLEYNDYLYQGWDRRQTPEHRSKIASDTNRRRAAKKLT